MSENKLNNSSITEQCYKYMVDNNITRLNIYDFLDHIRPTYEVSDEEFASVMSYFYTDLNLDGRFVCVDDGSWMLKDTLSVEDVQGFVEPSISTYSLDEFDYDEEVEDEDIVDELDSHIAEEDAEESDEDLYGFESGESVTSQFAIDPSEDEF